MKVCTDSCLFGAYINPASANSILDIGTGTGLLSLMLAQRYSAAITAVEIDPDSAQEAKNNISASRFNENIVLLIGDIRNKNLFTAGKKFDAIICNPPFYEQHLRSTDHRRNVAMHSSALNYAELAEATSRLLKPDGEAFFIIPYKVLTSFQYEFEKQKLFVQHACIIKNFTHTEPFRVIIKLSEKPIDNAGDTIIIYEEPNRYTSQVAALLKPYYLYL